MSGPAPEPPPPVPGMEGITLRLIDLAGQDRVSVADILEGFGEASFVPLLVVPALIVVTPLSGIPFLPTILGATIALVALQMAARRRHLWLPGFLKRRTISGARLAQAVSRASPMARWIDRHSRNRLHFLVAEPVATFARLACASCGMAMPFLELVPFSSSILASAVLLFSVGFLAADGLYVLLAAGVMCLAASIPIALLF
ncbi:MAG: exopolysaccharide biosynthesis protein [Paracoccaceae bacterium]|nr:exopolysaccharide biosynthesis protein [Paracoccaceae bacterium]